MASAYAALGKARRKQSKIARERAIGMEAISSAGEIATFAVGQKKKADTAWGEYEAGYKELGGTESIERPKFGQKGYFKGPEGDVRIGNTMYDRSKIQEAGSFLSSDTANVLDEGTRSQYLQRTAPGTALPDRSFAIGGADGVKLGQKGRGVGVSSGFGEGTGGRFSPVMPKTVSTSGGAGVGAGFGQGTGGVQHELTGGDFQPFVASSGDAAGKEETVAIQARQQEQLNLMSQGRAPGVFSQTREGGAPVPQDNSLDAILQRQSDAATPSERRTSMIGYGGGGTGIDPSIQGTGNEFIDRQLGGYTEPAPASIYPESRYGEYRKRLVEGQKGFEETGSYKRYDQGGDTSVKTGVSQIPETAEDPYKKRNLMESLDGNQKRTIQQVNTQKPWWETGEMVY